MSCKCEPRDIASYERTASYAYASWGSVHTHLTMRLEDKDVSCTRRFAIGQGPCHSWEGQGSKWILVGRSILQSEAHPACSRAHARVGSRCCRLCCMLDGGVRSTAKK